MSSPLSRPPAPLRWLASKLLRGPESHYIVGDLDEAFGRDVEGGTSNGRASVRYFRNTVHSALSVSSARRRGGMRGERVGERVQVEQLGLRAAADYPQTHAQLRPTVAPYGENVITGQIRWVLAIARTLLVCS